MNKRPTKSISTRAADVDGKIIERGIKCLQLRALKSTGIRCAENAEPRREQAGVYQRQAPTDPRPRPLHAVPRFKHVAVTGHRVQQPTGKRFVDFFYGGGARKRRSRSIRCRSERPHVLTDLGAGQRSAALRRNTPATKNSFCVSVTSRPARLTRRLIKSICRSSKSRRVRPPSRRRSRARMRGEQFRRTRTACRGSRRRPNPVPALYRACRLARVSISTKPSKPSFRKLAGHVHAVPVGQHDVEDDEVERSVRRHGQIRPPRFPATSVT